MELFKIIKKTFDLVRKEVTQALSDSKGHAQKLVDAEATRVDTVIEGKVDKVEYTPTFDFSPERTIIANDQDFIEWNILRRIYTEGVVFKTGNSKFRYCYTATGDATEDVTLRTFYEDKTKRFVWSEGYSSGLVVAYNIQFLDEAVHSANAFENCSQAKYISITPHINNDAFTSVRKMFYGCVELVYTDHILPTKATDYFQVYYDCQKLRHLVTEINWENAESASYAFYNNYMLGIGDTPTDGSFTTVAYKGISVNLPVCEYCTNMFDGCKSISYISTFNAPKATYLTGLFNRCESLMKVDSLVINSATTTEDMFQDCGNLTEIGSITHSDDINISVRNMFCECESLEIAPSIPGRLSNMYGFVYKCRNLTTMPLYYTRGGSINITYAFANCEKLTNVGGFDGIAMSFSFEDSPLLTRESCQNIFNHSGDLNGKSASISLHHEAYARLTEEDIAIAVNKGWAVQSI